MAAESPGSRLEGKQSSDIEYHTLRDKATTASLTTLHTLVKSSFGPSGKLKVIHNNSGGNAIVTSCSLRLFPALSVSKPVVRLLTTAVQSHIATYSDGGLFTALFALNLIQNSPGLDLHPRLISEIYELLLRQSLNLLENAQFNCKLMLDLGNLAHLEKLIGSVITPKAAGSGLSESDISHITKLVVRAFLKTFKGSSEADSPFTSGVINYVKLEGLPASESHILDGILFAEPHIPTYTKRQFSIPRLPDGTIRVAIFTASMAGDSDQLLDATYEISTDDPEADPIDPQDAVVDTLEEMASGLISAGVGVVCCQKVVHPYIKELLQTEGVLVIARLGSTHIWPIQKLTGGTLLADVHGLPPVGAYGVLDGVDHVVLGRRSHLHLQRHTAPVCTLVTCQRTDSCSEELMHVVKVSEDVLRQSLVNSSVLAGGGCWQVHLAAHLRRLISQNSTAWCRELSCSPVQLSRAGEAFCLSLDQVAMATSTSHDTNHMTDLGNCHHWTILQTAGHQWIKDTTRCSCGLIQSDSEQSMEFSFLGRETSMAKAVAQGENSCVEFDMNDVEAIDLYEVSVNGLKTAVASANMVLGIQNYIHDTN